MEYKYEGHSLKSGIYKIINKINGRIYIGSAKRFKTRWSQHTSSLRNQKHSNKFLQSDYNKCGEDAFMFEVIEVTEGKTKEERLIIEEAYIKQFYNKNGTCYNLTTRAVSPEGCRSKNPEETKRKHSESSKRFWLEASEEEKKLWASKVSEGRRKYLGTLEGRLKNAKNGFQKGNSAIGKGREHPNAVKVYQIDPATKTIVAVYDNVKEAIKKSGSAASVMYRMLDGKQKKLEGFVWIRETESILDIENHIKELEVFYEQKLNNAKTQQSERMKKYWSDPAVLQKQKEIQKNRWSSMSEKEKEQLQNKLSTAAIQKLKNPEARLKNAKNGFQKGSNGTGLGKNHHGAQPIAQIDIESGEVIKIYDCIEDAIRQANVSKAEIYRVLRGAKKSTKGFGWIRLDNNHLIIEQKNS